MTSDNLVEIGNSWFRQLRTLMNNYLACSDVHIFGKESGRMSTTPSFGPQPGSLSDISRHLIKDCTSL